MSLDNNRFWYVIKVVSGKELEVKRLLEKFFSVETLVPEEEILIRHGKVWIGQRKVMFSGYVFVSMPKDYDLWRMIKDMWYILGFLNKMEYPERNEDMERVKALNAFNTVYEVAFDVDGKLRFLDEKYNILEDLVCKVDKRQRKAKLVFGIEKGKKSYVSIPIEIHQAPIGTSL